MIPPSHPIPCFFSCSLLLWRIHTVPYSKGKYTPYWSTFPTSYLLLPTASSSSSSLPHLPSSPFLLPPLTCPSLLASVSCPCCLQDFLPVFLFFFLPPLPLFIPLPPPPSCCSSDPTFLTMAPPIPNLTSLPYICCSKSKKEINKKTPKEVRYSFFLLKLVRFLLFFCW